MKVTARAKLLLIVSGFLLPIAASVATYVFFRPQASGNYGELISPPEAISAAIFRRDDGEAFRFGQLRGQWVMLASESRDCDASCTAKLYAMRQVRLVLGRDASRVVRVLVAQTPQAVPAAPHEDLVVLRPAAAEPAGPVNDPGHVYLVDPRGNVMMRWPREPDMPRMLKDLKTLLKASQIG
jgi:cytochrome oxidase Cu insertion factor (SCO1/SenC/PrrC family)